MERAKASSPAFIYPISLLVNETAAKIGEILTLQWKDIRFKSNTILLNRSTELQPRSFIVSETLLEAIRKIDRVSYFVFTTVNDQPLKKHILTRELRRFQRRAGLSTAWGLKDLRASYGFRFLKDGGSIAELQKLMGHVRPYQTKEIFGRYSTLTTNINESEAV